MLKHIHVPRFPFHTILSFVFCIISSFGCVFYSLQFWLLFFLHPPHSFCCILPIVFVAFFPDLAADFCCCIFSRFVVAFSPDISHSGRSMIHHPPISPIYPNHYFFADFHFSSSLNANISHTYPKHALLLLPNFLSKKQTISVISPSYIFLSS